MQNKRIYIYLLAGQSNMAGRGMVPEKQGTNPRILVLNQQNKWAVAKDPLHWDKSAAGVGPGLSFAQAILKNLPDNTTIGLVPCACGGSQIEAWQEGKLWEQTNSYPLDDTFSRMQVALKDGELKGILWHQGEGDSTEESAPLYLQKLEDLISRFRENFKVQDVPFIIGQIGQFPNKPWNEYQHQVDNIHKTIAETIPYCAYVSSDGLTSIGDDLHFNTESQEKFGKRYAKAYQSIIEN
jgi:hypothetical protein